MAVRSRVARTCIAVAVVAVVVGAGCSDDAPTRGEDGAIEDEGSLGAFAFELGDCFDDPEDVETQVTVVAVEAIPCNEPHDNETFALIDLEGADDEYPGVDTVTEEGRERCLAEFEPYVGIDYETSVLDFGALLLPTEETWEAGDREIVCAVYNGDLSPLTGSVKGSAR